MTESVAAPGFSQTIVDEVIDTIQANPNWKEVWRIACKNSKSTPYLVGGKVYRTLIEVVYGYPARAECVDYDFVTESVAKKKKVPYGWMPKVGPNYPTLNLVNLQGSIRLKSKKGCCIDIVSTKDILQIKDGRFPEDISGYLRSVPLNIQSIALDIHNRKLIGDVGKQAVMEQKVHIHNHESYAGQYLFKRHKTIATYLRKKAASIKFDVGGGRKDDDLISHFVNQFNLQIWDKFGLAEKQILCLPPLADIHNSKKGKVTSIISMNRLYAWSSKEEAWVEFKPKPKKQTHFIDWHITSTSTTSNFGTYTTGATY